MGGSASIAELLRGLQCGSCCDTAGQAPCKCLETSSALRTPRAPFEEGRKQFGLWRFWVRAVEENCLSKSRERESLGSAAKAERAILLSSFEELGWLVSVRQTDALVN